MGGVHISHLKTRSFSCEPSRAQGGKSAFMCNFGQGIGLVHKLRELTRTEKLFDHSGEGFGVDQIMGHQCLDVLKAHSFLDRPLNSHQSDMILIFEQLSDRPHAAVSQMVDVVHRPLTVFQANQVLHHLQDIPSPQRRFLVFKNFPEPPPDILGEGSILQGRHHPDRMEDLRRSLDFIGHFRSGDRFVKIEPSVQNPAYQLRASGVGRSGLKGFLLPLLCKNQYPWRGPF